MGEASSNLTAQRACTLDAVLPGHVRLTFQWHTLSSSEVHLRLLASRVSLLIDAAGRPPDLLVVCNGAWDIMFSQDKPRPMCHVIDKLLTALLAPAAPLARVPVRVLSGLFTCPSCKDTAQPCSHHDQSPREVQFVHQTAECAPALAIKHTMAFLDNQALVRSFSSVHQPDECIGGHLLGSGAKTQAQALIRLMKPEHLPLGEADQTNPGALWTEWRDTGLGHPLLYVDADSPRATSRPPSSR